ncbi:oligomeric, coiled-coil, peripheral membrane protein [Collariella sp. IMI 366227]|nr:oligomeric, coiled-coil, peripheral membrane protein [Collariella sp. IMI 366227]
MFEFPLTAVRLDDFKTAVARQTSIPAQCIITLTPHGKPLKQQTLQTERYTVVNPPNEIEDARSVQSWQELFKTRWAWAVKVVEDCRKMASATEERYSELEVMLRCLDAAVTNLESVIKALEPKHAELKSWLPAAQSDYSALTAGWEQYLSFARSISVSPAMVRFMTGVSGNEAKGRIQRQATLEDLVNLETARRAGRAAPAALRKFNSRIADLEKVAPRMFQDAEDLFREFERTVERSATSHSGEAQQLFHDIEALSAKIHTDLETTLEYTHSSRDVLTQASKIAANHTERLLPSLGKRSLEMDDMLRYATQARNSLAAESIEFMRSITDITAMSHSVKSQINAVNQENEFATFDYLRLIQQVPYMYASYVVEAVRRREWLDKIWQDSSTLADEVAVFQEEELKRRRRWHKSVGDAYGPETGSQEISVPGLEVGILGQEELWPAMTRKDVEDFFSLLQTNKADSGIIEDVAKMVAEMNTPTKLQTKRMKAFKNGSIHEAALGRSGLLLRGDDDMLRSVQDSYAKSQSKLKTAESRVRRLEDLLHRQTQASRPSLGTLFQTPSQQLYDHSDSSLSIKTQQGTEPKPAAEDSDALAQRVQQLEAELAAEKDRSTTLEKDLTAQATLYNDLKSQMDEGNSTKKDLLENLEALKKEFNEERKSLESENKRLQARLEDTEDEIENFGESRENEKANYDETIHALQLEVERLTKEKHDETLKAEGRSNFLREETRVQREKIETQERQLRVAQEEAKGLNKELEALNELADMQLKALRDLWVQLSPGEAVPGDVSDLADGILVKASNTVARMRDVEADACLLRSDLDSAEEAVSSAKVENSALAGRLSDEESTSTGLREALSEEKAKFTALEAELADERDQLSQLRTKISDGETGSESLRKRLEEEERKLTQATEELALRQSQVGSLEEEVRHLKERLQESQAKLSNLTTRSDARSGHAKDLTKRLYSQNERLTHLLERLGFSVTRQGSSMVIQKIPRAERSSQTANDSDPSASLRRSGTLNSRVALVCSADLDLLNWVNSPDMDTESAKYDTYLSCLGSFDMDAFSEIVYRRVKDVEHMARKLQRDGRAYREKAHTLQKEAHEKIAYKHFKEGDLALFLPTRNQTTGAWAAFNVGFPHYFLREQEGHRLRSREWLVARISRVQERVVDLSKSLQTPPGMGKKGGGGGADSSSFNDDENDNPFDLSDGLRWYLIDAAEDKPGAPSTPGLAKSTVAANNVEAVAERYTRGQAGTKGVGTSGRVGVVSGIEGVSKTLSKSLESRRSSTGSKKALPFAIGAARGGRDSAVASETNSLRAAPGDTPAATSPTQQHLAVHGASHHGSPQTAGQAAGGQQSAQNQTEVRNIVDSLMGP